MERDRNSGDRETKDKDSGDRDNGERQRDRGSGETQRGLILTLLAQARRPPAPKTARPPTRIPRIPHAAPRTSQNGAQDDALLLVALQEGPRGSQHLQHPVAPLGRCSAIPAPHGHHRREGHRSGPGALLPPSPPLTGAGGRGPCGFTPESGTSGLPRKRLFCPPLLTSEGGSGPCGFTPESVTFRLPPGNGAPVRSVPIPPAQHGGTRGEGQVDGGGHAHGEKSGSGDESRGRRLRPRGDFPPAERLFWGCHCLQGIRPTCSGPWA